MKETFSNRIYNILKKYQEADVNDLTIPLYWEELTNIFCEDMTATVELLLSASGDDICYLSSIFDDIAEKSPTTEYYACLDQLLLKFPSHKKSIAVAIGSAQNIMCEYMPLPKLFHRHSMVEREIKELFPSISEIIDIESCAGFVDYSGEFFWRSVVLFSIKGDMKASINFSHKKVIQCFCCLGYKSKEIMVGNVLITVGRRHRYTQYADFMLGDMAFRVELKGTSDSNSEILFCDLLEKIVLSGTINVSLVKKNNILDGECEKLDFSWFYI